VPAARLPVLDHVAVAVEAWPMAWPRYVTELGADWSSGGVQLGFAPSQLRFANGARLEVLQPWQIEANDFLRRFLDRNGPGPHHMTFKVPDIVAMLDRMADAGFTPVSVDLRDPFWKEAFLHPKDATGVVVQVAQSDASFTTPAPEGFPVERPPVPAALSHVTHAVADLGQGLALFAGLLGGTPEPARRSPDGAWECVTVRWDGPLAVRLVAPTTAAPETHPLRQWLGGRDGRVHHLALSQPGPASPADGGAAGVLPDEEPVTVVEPDDNLGVRLVVRRTPT